MIITRVDSRQDLIAVKATRDLNLPASLFGLIFRRHGNLRRAAMRRPGCTHGITCDVAR